MKKHFVSVVIKNKFQDALKVLNIEDYSERIFNSNSHGELFHLQQYFLLAETYKDNASEFSKWFEHVVKWAEENWSRPESVFQHILKIRMEYIEDIINSKK